MKWLIYFLSAVGALAQGLNPAVIGNAAVGVAGGAAPTYLLEENFEDTGVPSGWSSSGTVDWDEAVIVGQGSESLKLDGSSADAYATTTAFTAQNTAYAYFMCYCTGYESSSSILFVFRDGTTTRQTIYILTDGRLQIQNGGTANTVDSIPTDTWFHVRSTYANSGTCTIEFSLDGTWAGSGNKFASLTGTAATTVSNLRLYADQVGAGGHLDYFDRVLVDDEQIVDNP